MEDGLTNKGALDMTTSKQNFFPTLNDALESEGLVKYWPLGSNIQYNQTIQHIVIVENEYHLISVYRNEQGYYERPIHYDTL